MTKRIFVFAASVLLIAAVGCDNERHAYVDLGLPSGLKWATCNVGASSPEDYGGYFAWGETEPKNSYDWSTYQWMTTGQSSWEYVNKYQFADGQTSACWYSNGTFTGDGKTVLELSDDAARANWGGSWRMPTHEEFQELYKKCTWTWTTQNGVKGYKVTSNRNGNSIFLPAAGYRSESSLLGAGERGYYWSSSLSENYSGLAWYLYFDSDYRSVDLSVRYDGQSVRPVTE